MQLLHAVNRNRPTTGKPLTARLECRRMPANKQRGGTQRSQLERSALLTTRALVDRMRALYRELERRTGAPVAMHRALACIEAEPGLTASQLAQRLGMQRPAVSHLLRALTQRRWIERARSDDDQRSVQLRVTRGGRDMLGATVGQVAGTLQRAVRRLDNTRLRQLQGALGALLELLPEAPPAARRARKDKA